MVVSCGVLAGEGDYPPPLVPCFSSVRLVVEVPVAFGGV